MKSERHSEWYYSFSFIIKTEEITMNVKLRDQIQIVTKTQPNWARHRKHGWITKWIYELYDICAILCYRKFWINVSEKYAVFAKLKPERLISLSLCCLPFHFYHYFLNLEEITFTFCAETTLSSSHTFQPDAGLYLAVVNWTAPSPFSNSNLKKVKIEKQHALEQLQRIW